MVNHTKCQDALSTQGFCKTNFELSKRILEQISCENWAAVDGSFKELTSENGELFKFLKNFELFDSIEFIISIRDSTNEWEEDGIWHDDGSRKLAFSLSLVPSQNIEGGVLQFRKKGHETASNIPPFNTGEMIIFKTGTSGYEHKICQVTSGRRVIIAGWCS